MCKKIRKEERVTWTKAGLKRGGAATGGQASRGKAVVTTWHLPNLGDHLGDQLGDHLPTAETAIKVVARSPVCHPMMAAGPGIVNPK